MSGGIIRDVGLAAEGDGGFGAGGSVALRVRFAVEGGVRDAFTEENWTRAYEKYDNTFKLKYAIKVRAGGGVAAGLKRRHPGGGIDSYRKASIFWTRNPKLVNPMKDKRVWVQVAKNFKPTIRLTEEGTRAELFDFDERVTFRASDLGPGTHRVSAEATASWQKHDFVEAGSAKGHSAEAELRVY